MTTMALQYLQERLSDKPYGDEVILFDFNNSPRLGTRDLMPGSTFIFSTDTFPVPEPLQIIGQTPFKNSKYETNTPLRIIDQIDPGKSVYEFVVVYRNFQQTVNIELDTQGAEVGEMHWNADVSKFYPWRAVLRLPGSHATAKLVKELSPSSPYANYKFEVHNQVTGARIPTIPHTGFQSVTAQAGYYTIVAVPPSDPHDSAMQVGGTDAADLIITPI